MDLDPFAMHFRGGFKNCACLHFGNFGINDAEPATTMTEHRIEFVQLVHAPGDLISGHAKFVCQFALLCVIAR